MTLFGPATMTSDIRTTPQTGRKPLGNSKAPSRLSAPTILSGLCEFTTGYNAISQVLVEEVADLVQVRTRVAARTVSLLMSFASLGNMVECYPKMFSRDEGDREAQRPLP